MKARGLIDYNQQEIKIISRPEMLDLLTRHSE